MVDLKNCPFCGGKATLYPQYGALGAWISCAGCGLEGPTETGVTAAEAIAAWNRRALQAVGPEPATWEYFCDRSYFDMWCVRRKDAPKVFGDGYHVMSEAEAKSLAAYLNSALVATPPAEPVGEAPQPATTEAIIREAAERVVWFDWSSNDPDAVDAVDALRAALATKPAVKDDETVVALPPTREYVDRIVRIFRDRPADDTSAVVLQDYARAALAAKDGRS